MKQSLEKREWSLHTVMCTHNICCISSPNTAFIFSIIIPYGDFCSKPPSFIDALFVFSKLCSLCASICIVSIGLFSSSVVLFPCHVQCTTNLFTSLRFSICVLIMLIVSIKFLNIFIIVLKSLCVNSNIYVISESKFLLVYIFKIFCCMLKHG